ncbi:MAG: sensor histidine kinase [Anaerocolumna sp.]
MNEIPINIILLIIQTISAFLFVDFFFKKRENKLILIIISCIIYILLRFIIRLFIVTPVITILFDYLAIFFIAQNYKTTPIKNIFFSLYIVMIFSAAYAITTLLTPDFSISITKVTVDRSVFVELISEFINISIIMIIYISQIIINKSDLTKSIRIIMIYIPVSTLFILSLIFETSNISDFLKIMAFIVGISINYIVFLFFNIISQYIEERIRFKETEKQNLFYENELRTIQNTTNNIRTIKHDINNHLNVLFGLLSNNDIDECKHYIDEIRENIGTSTILGKSGNIPIDSLINYKLGNLEKQINVSVELKIPADVNIRPFDLSVIFGNLIDNAIEGARTVQHDSYIKVKLLYNRGMLSIIVENSFDGQVKEQSNSMLSRKRSFSQVGNGIAEIKNAVELYNGEANFYISGNIFKCTVILYEKHQ